ncbi:MAG TPA: hypothetical protein VHC19_21145 [Pirellulales bacterium]|jgi:hypothetical protein|nr:hypothetical protein [Pirellulales bacterium]
MNDECVVGVYDTLEKAEQAILILKRGDFPTGQVSLIAAGSFDKPELTERLAMDDDSVFDAALGAGLGGVLGVLVGIGAIVVSEVGAVFLAGPVAGGLTAGIVGAFLGCMAGWGVHQQHIQRYEQAVKEGKALVMAGGSPLQLRDAEKMLKETDALEVHLHARTSSESPEVFPRQVPAAASSTAGK